MFIKEIIYKLSYLYIKKKYTKDLIYREIKKSFEVIKNLSKEIKIYIKVLII